MEDNMGSMTISEPTAKTGGMALSMLNQIPANERAVEEAQKAEVAINSYSTDLALEVPEDERAEDQEPDRLSEVRKLGVFAPVVGMSNILNALDNRIFARINVSSDGTRFIEYCEQYSDGRFSQKMKIKQSELLLAAQYSFISRQISESKVRNKVANFIINTTEEYLGKFDGPEEALDIIQLLTVLQQVRTSLPVYKEEGTAQNPELFYETIIQKMDEASLMMLDEHKAYYTLDDGHIERLARFMDMKKLELLRKLKEYGFLYLPPSSKGYQTNVRFKLAPNLREQNQNQETFTAWMYCIYKLDFFANLKGNQK